MPQPLVAIVGSADPNRRDYDPPLANIEIVKQAAEELGAELAKAGCRILVYSSSAEFIEADVVRGYVASGCATPNSIEVRYPQGAAWSGPLDFPELATHQQVFDVQPSRDSRWEVSFWRSLIDAHGVLLIGGGRSALVTGLVAQTYHIPLLALATFGGSALTVWTLGAGNFASEAERAVMGLPTWTRDSAAKLVKALGNQRERVRAEQTRQRERDEVQSRKMQWRIRVAGSCFLGALFLATLGVFWSVSNPVLFGAIFLGTPLLAGASGGVVRSILDSRASPSTIQTRSTLETATLGMIAGLIVAVLFVLAQMASNPEIKNLSQGIPAGLNLLVLFAFVVGFVGGLTLEIVFGKLQQADVVNVEALPGTRGDLR